jgi:hypothetical protein
MNKEIKRRSKRAIGREERQKRGSERTSGVGGVGDDRGRHVADAPLRCLCQGVVRERRQVHVIATAVV